MFNFLDRHDDDFVAKCLDPAKRTKLIAENQTMRHWAIWLGIVNVVLFALAISAFLLKPESVTNDLFLAVPLLGLIGATGIRAEANANLRILKLAEASSPEGQAERLRAA